MDLPELNCDAEEANNCIIPHLNKISLNQNACAVVLSMIQVHVLCYYITCIHFRITGYPNFGCNMEQEMPSKLGRRMDF